MFPRNKYFYGHYYYYYSFSNQLMLMVFHWSLSDSKSPQVSRTLFSILAVLNNAVFWMVSTRQPISKSSRPYSNSLVTVPKAPITIGIIVTCMFHSFFNSQARSRYLSFFSHSIMIMIIIIIIICLLYLGVSFYNLTSNFKKIFE